MRCRGKVIGHAYGVHYVMTTFYSGSTEFSNFLSRAATVIIKFNHVWDGCRASGVAILPEAARYLILKINVHPKFNLCIIIIITVVLHPAGWPGCRSSAIKVRLLAHRPFT